MLCAKLEKITKQTHLSYTVVLLVVLAFCCLPLPWQLIGNLKWRVINKKYVVNRLLSLTVIILCLDKLGKMNRDLFCMSMRDR